MACRARLDTITYVKERKHTDHATAHHSGPRPTYFQAANFHHIPVADLSGDCCRIIALPAHDDDARAQVHLYVSATARNVTAWLEGRRNTRNEKRKEEGERESTISLLPPA